MSRIPARLGSLLLLLLMASLGSARAQTFEFVAPASVDEPVVAERMRDLAERMLPVYQEKDTERYLANLAALQLVAGNPAAAGESRRSLQERRQAGTPRPVVPYVMLHDLIVRARAAEASEKLSFADAFAREFRKQVPVLADREAHALTRLMLSSPTATRDALQEAFDRIRPRGRIETAEAMELVWMYLWFDAYRRTGGTAPDLVVQEDTRRYLSDQEVVIKGRWGVELAVRVVRPRHPQGRPLPAVLEFTIDPSRDQAHESAAHGYVGVVAYTRGKKRRDGRIIAFEHERQDVRTVIEWIAQQPWSDGRVAMIGQGYSGFAAWAALKDPPAALKAVVTADAMAPGIDFPMEGNVMRNQALRWASEHTQGLREVEADDPQADARWRAVDLDWYRSGRPYRDLDRIAHEPNRVFRRWIGHPSYDRYWQKMIPQAREFAKVQVPVLTITGYYAQGAVGAMHYFGEHVRRAPQAAHVLLAGPWDERAIEDRPARMLRGYALEPGARLDLQELRFEWLDHVLAGASRPAVLADRVNLWMPGAGGGWRRAPDVQTLAAGSPLRLHLETRAEKGETAGSERRLLVEAPGARHDAFFEQRVDRKDRSDPGEAGSAPIVTRGPALRYAVQYVSEPLAQPVEVAGMLSGQLDLRPSRMDVDLQVTLYERLANGEHVMLCDPWEFRASYVRDRSARRLLRAGVRQQLALRSQQLMARRLQAGSRLVLVLGVIQQANRQINYGLGDDVNAESLKRAGSQGLRIRWYSDSWIELPVRP